MYFGDGLDDRHTVRVLHNLITCNVLISILSAIGPVDRDFVHGFSFGQSEVQISGALGKIRSPRAYLSRLYMLRGTDRHTRP